MIQAAPAYGSRPFLAFDGDGHFLGDFAEWLPAHRWAHQRAAEPGTRLPVEIEDRGRTYTEQVWPEHCQALHCTPPVVVLSCPLADLGPAALRMVADADARPGEADGPGRAAGPAAERRGLRP